MSNLEQAKRRAIRVTPIGFPRGDQLRAHV